MASTKKKKTTQLKQKKSEPTAKTSIASASTKEQFLLLVQFFDALPGTIEVDWRKGEPEIATKIIEARSLKHAQRLAKRLRGNLRSLIRFVGQEKDLLDDPENDGIWHEEESLADWGLHFGSVLVIPLAAIAEARMDVSDLAVP